MSIQFSIQTSCAVSVSLQTQQTTSSVFAQANTNPSTLPPLNHHDQDLLFDGLAILPADLLCLENHPSHQHVPEPLYPSDLN